MSILEQFAMSLAPKQNVAESFFSGQDRLLDRQTGIADLMYRRSLAKRAEVDAAQASAEWADYQQTADLQRQAKFDKLRGTMVDISIANNDIDQALLHQRAIDDTIPGDAAPGVVKRDGVEYIGWISPSTKKDGLLGSGSTAGVYDFKRKLKELDVRSANKIEELQASATGKTKFLSTRPVGPKDVLAVSRAVNTSVVEDTSVVGSRFGATSDLKSKLTQEDMALLKQDVASKANELEAYAKRDGTPFDYQAAVGALMKAVTSKGLRVDNGTFGLLSNVTYDPDSAATAMETIALPIRHRAGINKLRATFGDKIKDRTDEDLAILLERQANK